MDRRRRKKLAKPRPCAVAEVRLSVKKSGSISKRTDSAGVARENLGLRERDVGIRFPRRQFTGKNAGKEEPRKEENE